MFDGAKFETKYWKLKTTQTQLNFHYYSANLFVNILIAVKIIKENSDNLDKVDKVDQ